jgi:DNA-binding NarL/FixJ family response regulator
MASDYLRLRNSSPHAGIRAGTQSLIVIERRAVIAGGFGHWLRSIAPELDPILVATIDAVGDDIVRRANAAIFVTGAKAPAEDKWLCNEVICTRTRREDIPFVLFADTAEAPLIEEAIRQFLLSGYILTSSSLELAATALRLILAGGQYFPEGRHEHETTELSERPQTPSTSAPCAGLTPREHAVLELLECGVPNKIIAYRLGMSLSTVKAHVHNIIVKLNVRNRTEVAVFRYAAVGRSDLASGDGASAHSDAETLMAQARIGGSAGWKMKGDQLR